MFFSISLENFSLVSRNIISQCLFGCYSWLQSSIFLDQNHLFFDDISYSCHFFELIIILAVKKFGHFVTLTIILRLFSRGDSGTNLTNFKNQTWWGKELKISNANCFSFFCNGFCWRSDALGRFQVSSVMVLVSSSDALFCFTFVHTAKLKKPNFLNDLLLSLTALVRLTSFLTLLNQHFRLIWVIRFDPKWLTSLNKMTYVLSNLS